MTEEDKDRLQLEWLVVTALRENLSMQNDGNAVNYNTALLFGKDNFKELFETNGTVLGERAITSPEYEKYKEEAEAKSRIQNKLIAPEDLIKERILEIETLTKDPINKGLKNAGLIKEKKKLVAILKEEISHFYVLSENEALLNDYDKNNIDFEYIKQINGKYKIFKTKSGKPFVMRFLHPGKPEIATGVDRVHEYHHEGQVRIIAVQYKIWEKDVLYYSNSKNLQAQLDTAKKCFCDDGFCSGNLSNQAKPFRFPYCIPFLRPTDKLKNPDSFYSSGWHIPICQLDSRVKLSPNGNKILMLSEIKDIAVNANEFDRLFDKEMIGSRWFDIREIEAFYKKNKVLDIDDNSIFILSQSFR